jgi:hypothetical protein
MKRLIYSIAAAAFLACFAAIGFTPAQATITTPDLRPSASSSATQVHWSLSSLPSSMRAARVREMVPPLLVSHHAG